MPEEIQERVSIFVNGQARQVSRQWNLGQLASDYRLEPKQLLVELNGQTLLRDEWPQHLLEHGDRVEFIRVVAGG